MRIVAFRKLHDSTNSRWRMGALVQGGEAVLDLSLAVADQLAMDRPPLNPLVWFDLDEPWMEAARKVYESYSRGERSTVEIWRRNRLRLLAPVPRPGKIICIGLNYRDHAREAGVDLPSSPMIFSKFSTAAVGPDDKIVLPAGSAQVDFEAELAVVIGRTSKAVSPEEALRSVFGYTVFNDVSARDFQFPDKQWTRGKSCDTFAPFGPAVVTADEVPDPHRLSIRLRLNGEVMQDSNTSQMIFSIPRLISFISETITLEPGDVIATGTPAGVGFARTPPVFLKDGDLVEIEIEKLGTLRSEVTRMPVAASATL